MRRVCVGYGTLRWTCQARGLIVSSGLMSVARARPTASAPSPVKRMTPRLRTSLRSGFSGRAPAPLLLVPPGPALLRPLLHLLRQEGEYLPLRLRLTGRLDGLVGERQVVHVGGGEAEVHLLVGAGGGQDDVGEVRRRTHANIAGDDELQLGPQLVQELLEA